MRRIAAIAALVVAVAALALVGTGAADDDSQKYLVRAAFDNGNFIVPGEEVRIAGASVGSVESVDVSGTDEIVSMDPQPRAIPGKAIIVLRIDDPAFQDFRRDASCTIRPQSLLGEKFIDCQPTEPRAPGTEPPPPLEEVGEGEPGEGQRLLPVERTAKTVDLDLVNNIMRLPYRQRFSIILNEFGAGLAARGDDLGEIIDRGNPALRETDRVLAVLARQSATLKRLARDSATVLGPLAREREHVAGFIANAGETAAASAERRADLEEGLSKLPPSLVELRLLMRRLRGFSDQATPVFSDLGGAAPSIAGATRALGPLANAATPALRSLGNAAEQAGPDIKASDPVIKDIRGLADASERPAKNLSALLRSLRRTGGYDEFLKTVLNLSGSFNTFDQFGHLFRTQLLVTNCVDYVIVATSGCSSNFLPETSSRAALREQQGAAVLDRPTGAAEGLGGRDAGDQAPGDEPAGGTGTSSGPLDDAFGTADQFGAAPIEPLPQGSSMRGADELFRFLMEDGS
jgi:phospholipid/cholesterol/gamma-HCH transport system substrate-binding protein